MGIRIFITIFFIFFTLNVNAANDEFAIYKEVVKKIKEESINPIEDKRFMDGCLDGVVNIVDKNGNYLNEEEYEAFYDTSRSAAVGMSIFQRGSYFIVKTVIENSPADKAALKRGDKILKIDGKTLKQMNLKDVAQELRGSPNTKVKLTILKKNSKNQIDMLLTRKVMDTELITSKILQGNMAHIKINSFSQNSLHEILDDLDFISTQNYGKLNGMVLDLRDNPGGALTSGIAIASLFLPSDAVIINVESRKKEDKRQYKNTLVDYDGAEYASKLITMQFLKTIPLVVVVNGDSAGSSEIVASSLQEHGRALVVGVSTFGKDTFATVFPLTSKPSAIKLATARWTTPKGKSVWPNGVIPSIEVISDTDEEDAPLIEALKILSKK